MEITICSSVDFTPKIIEIKKELEEKGHKVNIPYITQKIIDKEISFEEYLKFKEQQGDIAIRETQPVDMIKRYWDFIKNSDAILVLNLDKKGIKNYIGGSTLMEMGFAYGHNKKIYLYNSIPERSERMHYVDEIKDMKPIILNQNLSKII
jgi:nucleoside 2-deoxyribosyltransferase